MMWKAKKERCLGDIRLKRRFLLFPKNINGEVRWLVKAQYKQKYETVYREGYKWYAWVNIKWNKK